jgi:membrane protein YqaA with SNARE-associated domain
VFGYVKLNPDMFWPAVLVATLGNTVGGAIDWWMGYAAKLAVVRYRLRRQNRQHEREHEQHLEHPKKASKPALDAKYFRWMRRWGPRRCWCRGCPVLVIHCALWRAGCGCRSGPASAIWPSASSCAIWR